MHEVKVHPPGPTNLLVPKRKRVGKTPFKIQQTTTAKGNRPETQLRNPKTNRLCHTPKGSPPENALKSSISKQQEASPPTHPEQAPKHATEV